MNKKTTKKTVKTKKKVIASEKFSKASLQAVEDQKQTTTALAVAQQPVKERFGSRPFTSYELEVIKCSLCIFSKAMEMNAEELVALARIAPTIPEPLRSVARKLHQESHDEMKEDIKAQINSMPDLLKELLKGLQ